MPRSYSSVYVHAIFATKNRHPFLTDAQLRSETHAYLGGISRNLGCDPVIIGGVEDHVHILANLGKTITQADWIKELKRASSLWAKQRDPRLKKFAWQIGYGAFSVDATDQNGLIRYIQNQEEHHRTVSFQEEFLALLKEHGLEWDPRDELPWPS